MANTNLCSATEVIHSERETEANIRNSNILSPDAPSFRSLTTVENSNEATDAHPFTEESRFDPEYILGASYPLNGFSLDHTSSTVLSNANTAPRGILIDDLQSSAFVTNTFPGNIQIPDKIMWATPQMLAMSGNNIPHVHGSLMEHQGTSRLQGLPEAPSPTMPSHPVIIGNPHASDFVQKVMKNVAGFKSPNPDLLQHTAPDVYASSTPSYVLLGKHTLVPDVVSIVPPSSHFGSLPVFIQLSSDVVPSLGSDINSKPEYEDMGKHISTETLLEVNSTATAADQAIKAKHFDVEHHLQQADFKHAVVISVVRPNSLGGKGIQQMINHFIEQNSLLKDTQTQHLECPHLGSDINCSSLTSLEGDSKSLRDLQCRYESQDALHSNQRDVPKLSDGMIGGLTIHNGSTPLISCRSEEQDQPLSQVLLPNEECADLRLQNDNQLTKGNIGINSSSDVHDEELACVGKVSCSRYHEHSSDEVDGSVVTDSQLKEVHLCEVACPGGLDHVSKAQNTNDESSKDTLISQQVVQTTEEQTLYKSLVTTNKSIPATVSHLLLDTVANKQKEKENGCSVIISIVPGNGTAAKVTVHRVESCSSTSGASGDKQYTREKTQISKPDISGGHNKLIRCDFCTATFTRQNNLTRHKKIHTVNLQEEKYYQCLYCKRPFLQRCDMNRHMQIHTKQEPFRCNTCGKGYIRKSDLVVHERFHAKSRVFKCDKCERCFCQSGDLKRHIRFVHAEKSLLTCVHCHHKYAKETTLIHHMKIAHNDILLQSASHQPNASSSGNSLSK
ncbi:uncharacterized protein LOC112564999 isoform X1 [Pomacea canaliculata]|uniref:uncharacterized protein LOC112564999 isoform X1 n=1 Tax=Pomacea canaliculata TaxID=400727 RepID=UPI000D727454|nr:uncharacterized protein LOC112564999 isoform X1 [Pomacea canaliculata]